MVRHLSLDARLDSTAAGGLRNELAEAAGGDVSLDAGAVEILGGLCLELLLCARSVWNAAGHTITIENPSAAFVENLSRFGLAPGDLATGDSA